MTDNAFAFISACKEHIDARVDNITSATDKELLIALRWCSDMRRELLQKLVQLDRQENTLRCKLAERY